VTVDPVIGVSDAPLAPGNHAASDSGDGSSRCIRVMITAWPRSCAGAGAGSDSFDQSMPSIGATSVGENGPCSPVVFAQHAQYTTRIGASDLGYSTRIGERVYDRRNHFLPPLR
jgi:hypothetical protein